MALRAPSALFSTRDVKMPHEVAFNDLLESGPGSKEQPLLA